MMKARRPAGTLREISTFFANRPNNSLLTFCTSASAVLPFDLMMKVVICLEVLASTVAEGYFLMSNFMTSPRVDGSDSLEAELPLGPRLAEARG